MCFWKIAFFSFFLYLLRSFLTHFCHHSSFERRQHPRSIRPDHFGCNLHAYGGHASSAAYTVQEGYTKKSVFKTCSWCNSILLVTCFMLISLPRTRGPVSTNRMAHGFHHRIQLPLWRRMIRWHRMKKVMKNRTNSDDLIIKKTWLDSENQHSETHPEIIKAKVNTNSAKHFFFTNYR